MNIESETSLSGQAPRRSDIDAQDIGEAPHTERERREHGHYRIQIADAQLEYRSVVIGDPVPTGREIIAAAGYREPEQFIVLQFLPTGDLEELRLNEHTDLREHGIEKFIVIRSDRSYRFTLESERQEWPASLINGQTLKRLGQKDPRQFAVLIERTDEADEEIDNDQFVDLAEPGVEQFYFRPSEQNVEIEVNEKKVRIARGDHTGLEIKQAAIAQGVRIGVDFVLTLHKPAGETQIIGDQDVVKVRRGQRYTAVADDDKS